MYECEIECHKRNFWILLFSSISAIEGLSLLLLPVKPLVPFVGSLAAKVPRYSGARCHLETMLPPQEARMQRRYGGQVHRGHRLSAEERLVRTAASQTGSTLFLTFEFRYTFRTFQWIRAKRSF